MTDTNDSKNGAKKWIVPNMRKPTRRFLDYTKWSIIIVAIILVMLLLFVYG